MNKYLLKYYLKRGIVIAFILLFAIVATRFIYDKFSKENDQVTPVENLEVTFHEKEKDKISITKVNPLTDALGLSSKAYTISVKNNSDLNLKYVIKILDDKEEYDLDGCSDTRLPIESIKLGYHKDKEHNNIVLLNELENGVLATDIIEPGKTTDYTIRLWIDKDTNLNLDKDGHYHGLIKVEEIE